MEFFTSLSKRESTDFFLTKAVLGVLVAATVDGRFWILD